uniref:uncharacterized protein LOC129506059 n=1 Tax=Nyctereutes procyonoides TaxID=34880 RepID=UPI0024438F3D|nr:uncharacterized protein LOC129506059 [Nyctereutes procyonoides]
MAVSGNAGSLGPGDGTLGPHSDGPIPGSGDLGKWQASCSSLVKQRSRSRSVGSTSSRWSEPSGRLLRAQNPGPTCNPLELEPGNQRFHLQKCGAETMILPPSRNTVGTSEVKKTTQASVQCSANAWTICRLHKAVLSIWLVRTLALAHSPKQTAMSGRLPCQEPRVASGPKPKRVRLEAGSSPAKPSPGTPLLADILTSDRGPARHFWIPDPQKL